ncbi:hypothetical protein G6F56_004997 [Rhizopus delemar]|nr:hypothetical protein G6F56_004997 [Rhizopus delemar]
MKLKIYRINMNQDVNNETFEFVCKRTTSQEEAENFLSVAYECIYEDEYKSSRSFIVDEKIIALYSPHIENKVCSSVLKPKLEVYGNSIPEDIAEDATSTFIRYIPFTGTERVHGTVLFLFEAILGRI